MTNNFSYFTGIDVSKDKVDIFCTETSTYISVKNSRADIRKAMKDMDRENTLVILENTGGYENVCIDTLQRIGYKIHRANNIGISLSKDSGESFGKTETTEQKKSIMYAFQSKMSIIR